MSKKKFTEDEIRLLSENTYTMLVTKNTLSFTIGFKELFWKDFLSGMTPREILCKYGYDPEVLGPDRIDGIQYTIKKAALYGNGFTNLLKPAPKANKTSSSPLAPLSDIKMLEQKLKYLEQEVEYLKKISSARTSRK